ncbi:peptide-N4-asparagine amidase [Solimicrobium silvestre]|uniref:Peptide N-acetyl-beta-D-glucosaminyl asparaginase amidase A n=1 Tax=Solimicrobium silvestre TaxID=2099400 RepID=A0A2S9GXY8_9BURK|nr:peptide-N4-asparagine amidase [Solimicrobium silvestre]PRC92582.1 Peptide N-acetyl-beta-D-glucosaminyl asparaginase amidase A [Solimicrobium silvestre]
MRSCFASHPVIIFSSILLSSLLSTSATAAALPPGFTLGSANVAIADPAVPRPSSQPCTVVLFSNQQFADFNNHSFNYAPPAACPGPWSKVVLEVDLSINAGNQYDRTAHIWLGGVNIYTGTTEEPSATVARNWHVERDITDYSALLNAAQQGSVDLGNIVNSTYTGILQGTATLQLYPAVPGFKPARTPDVVYPMSASATGGAVALNTTTDQLTQTITFPRNVERAFIDVLAQGQSGDEFWYTCVPNALSSQLQSCGSTAFREAEISIDGQAAGVAPVYPWIFTGGIDPLLWRPTPGVQTLNLLPYRVDISPFAAQLSNGQSHTVAISVYNANNYFLASGAVLVYRDPKTVQVTGALTSNTLAAIVAPTINNQLVTDSQGNVTGTLTTSSKRNFKIAGYIQTSHGRIDTMVTQNMHYQNKQAFTINSSDYVQNISQQTEVETDTGVFSNGSEAHEHHHANFPLTMNINYATPPGQPVTQATTVVQAFDNSNWLALNGWMIYQSEVHNKVSPSDTLNFDASGNFTGNSGQQSVQKYTFTDSTGSCYKRTVTSSAGLLTAVTDGKDCRGNQNAPRWFVDPYGIALPDLSTLNMYR